ncbi:unnamed protein product [Allacma fusca]|uniref:RNA helicase n=1 Tax=Allacma fusca TaxID=39272 RepID=A0A8J2LU57_9HEXA|nr:unnamed protein product [Allacma fusca]
MGKKAKETRRYNSRARSQGQISIDQTEANKIQVDLKNVDGSKYDDANPLVLPSKKRNTTVKFTAGSKKEKFLSKKQRKKLEKIVERREKKSNRADLVSELQNYQLSAETYSALTPLVKVQTEGVRTLLLENKEVGVESKKTASGRSGWKKSGAIVANKQKFLSWSRRFTSNGQASKNPQVLGFDTDEEESSEESEDEDIPESPGDDFSAVDAPSVDDEKETTEEEPIEEIDLTNSKLSDSPSVDRAALEEDRKRKFENHLGDSRAGKILKKARSKVEENKMKAQEKQSEEEVKMQRKVIHVNRTEEILASRSKLPIIPEEQVVMEQISDNIYVVLAGETGCGKTTQVPQFLYEAGYATEGKIIGITEPRRVAAISMAARVGKELSLTSEEVSFQIRFEGTASSKTLIKFMTDGVLLKEMGHDFLLKKYSVVCIDEAHERSLFTDILIGLLSRCVVARKKRNDPLKLVIMSATMRISDFMENNVLFKTKPGFVHIPARQFPVQIHFSKVTPINYVETAVKKVIQIHKKLPPGGILVFVTGQQEVLTIIKHLQRLCPNTEDPDESVNSNDKKGAWRKRGQKPLKSVNLDEVKRFPEEIEPGSDSDNSETEDVNIDVDTSNLEPLHVIPLYSMLPIEDQKKVFEPPPPGKRLCVVTTNVAETSVTIPSIRYVVDTGKVKDKLWDKVTGVQTFRILWCSKASAEQRAGRAGRIGPGHCYRLFSSAVFEHEFQEYSTPEIKARPVDDMVLLMKSMSIDQVKNFPYPTPPDDEQLQVAEELLLHLGALQRPQGARKGHPSTISPLGLTMSQLPVGPRFAKMLAMSFSHSLAEYMTLLAAAFTVQEVLLEAGGDKALEEKWTAVRKKWTGVGQSALLGDAKVLIRAAEAFEHDGGSPEFCIKMGLRHKAMVEIRKLRKQLTNNINILVENQKEIILNPKLKPPSDEEATLLRQIILSGSPDRVARKVQPDEVSGGEDQNKLKNAYKCGELEDLVYIHHASVLRRTKPSWIVYQEAFEINGKIYLRGVVAIEPEWILVLCPTMCRFDKPLKDPPPYFDHTDGLVKCFMKSTYGKQGWELPVAQIEYPVNAEKYSYFAQFLLEGEVFSLLKQWSNSLLSLPKTMTKSWAKLQPRTQSLLEQLVSAEVDSKPKLSAQWEKNPKYLLKEYLEWVPERLHRQIKSSWPPVESSV